MCTMEVIVITGGSRGIGAAPARACDDRGLGVILTYNSHPEAAEAVVAQIGESGGRAVALPLDVAGTANFPAFGVAVTRTLEENWNGVSLHGLVNNAGFGLYNPIETVTEAQFDGLVSVYLTSFKGGLKVLTRNVAKESGPRRIRANAVLPGAIQTELSGGLTDAFEALLASQTALGRVGEAEEVGRVIASLLTDDLGWVNGQSIEVGGGYCI
jgi:NAD(P)-dependent dehydrogenase (short-subunit alcohol dehydrogenase family)